MSVQEVGGKVDVSPRAGSVELLSNHFLAATLVALVLAPPRVSLQAPHCYEFDTGAVKTAPHYLTTPLSNTLGLAL